ncbi:MAG: FAD-dependent monooxygenase, partial [Pseudomonadota bacterium]
AIFKNGVTVMVEAAGESGTLEAREITLMALVGADGVRSAVAGRVRGSEAAAFTGHIAWRGLIDKADFPQNLPNNTTGLWQLPNAHVVHYPLFQGRMVNVVVVVPHHISGAGNGGENTVQAGGWLTHKERRLPPEVREVLKSDGTAEPFQSIINSEGTWGAWPLFAHKRLGAWHTGAIGLVGDAAHAMVPYAAQGGCAAIEDAAVLADAFETHGDDANAAFAAYAKARKPRVARIMALSRSNRRIYHHGGPMRIARNLVMRHAPASFFEKRMDWLYGWRAG